MFVLVASASPKSPSFGRAYACHDARSNLTHVEESDRSQAWRVSLVTPAFSIHACDGATDHTSPHRPGDKKSIVFFTIALRRVPRVELLLLDARRINRRLSGRVPIYRSVDSNFSDCLDLTGRRKREFVSLWTFSGTDERSWPYHLTRNQMCYQSNPGQSATSLYSKIWF